MLITYGPDDTTIDIPVHTVTRATESKESTITPLSGDDYTVEHYVKWVYSFATPPIQASGVRTQIELALESLRNREPFTFVHPTTGELITAVLKGQWKPTQGPLDYKVSYSFKAKQA